MAELCAAADACALSTVPCQGCNAFLEKVEISGLSIVESQRVFFHPPDLLRTRRWFRQSNQQLAWRHLSFSQASTPSS